MSRRNFSRNQKEQIVERAKNAAGEICCEGCSLVLGKKPYEIDHIIAEALRPEADKMRPITIAEGQLLGMECCHRGEDGKTNQDIKKIAKGKRQYNRANGLAKAAGNLRGPAFPQSERAAARQPKPMPARRSLYQQEQP